MSVTSNQIKQLIISCKTGTDSQLTTNMIMGYIINKENEKNVALATNSLLSNSKTRTKGLEFIHAIIPHLSLEVLMENYEHWTRSCVLSHGNDPLKEIKLRTMTNIIMKLGDAEAFNKKFIQEHLIDTVKACLINHSSKEKITCLKCLTQCMEKYPSSLNNFREKIEILLTEFLDGTCSREVKEAAVAFHLWNQIGSAGVNGINYINNFHNNFNKLCATVHVLYDTLLENVHEITNFERISSEVFKFNDKQPNASAQKLLEITTKRIINCLIFIKTMIGKLYPVIKQIVPKYVVDIINRGLSVHICLSESNVLVSQESFLLQEIQLTLLQLLRTFVIGDHSRTLPFSNVLIKCVLNCLKRTNACSCFLNNSSYKIHAYKALISLMGQVEDYTRLQEALIPLLLEDIRPSERKILLNQNFKKQSSGPRNNINESTANTRYNCMKEETCSVALDVLQYYLTECPITPQEPLLQEVICCIVSTLIGADASKVESPYRSITCQIKLYEVLISLLKQECPSIELPIHLMSSIFHKGSKSHNHQISQRAREGLDFIEKISHPVCSSLCINDAKFEICQNVTECFEEIATKDTQVKNKEINVLSNVIISEPIVDNCSNEGIEVIIEKSVTETTDIQTPTQNGIGDSKDEGNYESMEEIIKSVDWNTPMDNPLDEAKREECVDEPPKKKQKEENDEALEDMFESFKDVVQ